MGLDDFATSGTTRTVQSNQPKQQQEQEDTGDDEPYKTVSCGGRKKVFQTEEEWEETADFIRDEMNLNPNEVLNMPAQKRHDVLHQAILRRSGLSATPFHPTRDCIVCGETFTYPNNWNFEKFHGEPVCPDHSLDEAAEAHEDINTIQG